VILRAEQSTVVHTEKLQSNEFAHLATQPLPVEATRSEQANEGRAGCQVGGLTKLVGERWWEGRDMGNRVARRQSRDPTLGSTSNSLIYTLLL
jgi:hypothetical protein